MNPKGLPYPTNNRKGYIMAFDGDGLVMDRPTKARGTVQSQSIPTMCCTRGGGCGVVTNNDEELRIRYLTPKECLRLMGFYDDDINNLMEAVPSDNQLYKLAGNSIVVNVLESIFKGIYLDNSFNDPEPKQVSLTDFLKERPKGGKQ